MKNVIKKILKEKIREAFGDENKSKYERCSHFSNPQHKELCFNLYLGSFLYRDLGLRTIIDKK